MLLHVLGPVVGVERARLEVLMLVLAPRDVRRHTGLEDAMDRIEGTDVVQGGILVGSDRVHHYDGGWWLLLADEEGGMI